MLYSLSISTPLWMSSKKDRDEWMKEHGWEGSFVQLNRHLVLHGASLDYDTEKHSLQASPCSVTYAVWWNSSTWKNTVTEDY